MEDKKTNGLVEMAIKQNLALWLMTANLTTVKGMIEDESQLKKNK